MNAANRSAVDVSDAIDAARWGAYQQWLVALTAVTIIFDGIDNQLLGVCIPSMMEEWGAPRSAFAPIVALGFFGMMVGGAAAGIVGDRFGRKTALLWSVAVFGVATLASAGVGGPESLGILRMIAGLGLGGAIPNGAALAAEYVPSRMRPIAVTLTIVCVPLGGTLAGLIAIPALPAFGWRVLFAVGGAVPVGAALVLGLILPESPRYLARHPTRWPELRSLLARMGHRLSSHVTFRDAGGPATSHAPFSAIFAHGVRTDTFALWVAFFSCLLSVYLGFSWLPSILTSAGLGTAVANTGITVFNLGGVIGAIAGGMFITRFGSRITMLTMSAGAVGGALVLSAMPMTPESNVAPIIAMLAFTGGMINAVQTTMYALAAHVYPTVLRARGVGTAVAIGRSGAIVSGYAGPWALEIAGSTSFFGLMAAAVTVTFVALAIVNRHVPRPY